MEKRRQTREKILDIAESLFSKNGFASTSIRKISEEGKFNISAVNYYFGSKKNLIKEVFARRINPINQERLRMLEEVKKMKSPTLKDLLRAIVEPVIKQQSKNLESNDCCFKKLYGKLYAEPDPEIVQIIIQNFHLLMSEFMPLLKKLTKGIPNDELFIKVRFFKGAMFYTLHDPFSFEWKSNKLTLSMSNNNLKNPDMLIEALVSFCAEGFKAKSFKSRKKGK